MPVTRTMTANPEQLRARFREARRMPQLLEIRDQVRLSMRQASDDMDAADGTGDGLTELQGLFAQLKALLDQIDEKITRQATIDDLERRAAGTPLRDGTDRDFERQCHEFSIFRAAAHAIGLHGVDASREIEIQAELVRRSKDSGRPAFTGNIVVPLQALSVQVRHLSGQNLRNLERRVIGSTQPPGTTGGALIGTYTDPEQYIDVLRPAMAVRQAGARVLTGLTSNLRLPRLTQSAVPGWFAENSPIPVSDQSYDDVIITPHHDGVIGEVTRNVLQQSNPEIEALFRNDAALRLANDVDRTAIAGTGVAPQPLGIVTDPLVPNLPAAALSYDAIVDLIEALATRNALNGSLAFIGDAAVMASGMKLKDLYGRPLGDELLYHGYPTFWTNLASFPGAPTDPICFGDFENIIIAFFSELDVLVNPFSDSAYSKGNVQIRCAMTLDIQKRHPESFAWMSVTDAGLAATTERPPAPARERSR